MRMRTGVWVLLALAAVVAILVVGVFLWKAITAIEAGGAGLAVLVVLAALGGGGSSDDDDDDYDEH